MMSFVNLSSKFCCTLIIMELATEISPSCTNKVVQWKLSKGSQELRMKIIPWVDRPIDIVLCSSMSMGRPLEIGQAWLWGEHEKICCPTIRRHYNNKKTILRTTIRRQTIRRIHYKMTIRRHNNSPTIFHIKSNLF